MTLTRASFTLKTSPTVKRAHVLGSWDHYCEQFPLMKIREGSHAYIWSNTFNFHVTILQPGKRYWYYYILNGRQVSYDPKSAITIEPTTRRILNILDVPSDEPTSNAFPRDEIPEGRPVEFCQIVAPIPGSSRIHSILFSETSNTLEDMACQFAAAAPGRVANEASNNSLTDESPDQSSVHSFPRAPANSPVNSQRVLEDDEGNYNSHLNDLYAS